MFCCAFFIKHHCFYERQCTSISALYPFSSLCLYAATVCVCLCVGLSCNNLWVVPWGRSHTARIFLILLYISFTTQPEMAISPQVLLCFSCRWQREWDCEMLLIFCKGGGGYSLKMEINISLVEAAQAEFRYLTLCWCHNDYLYLWSSSEQN